MRVPAIFKILESNYCKLVFIASLVFVYFLVPNKIFYKGYFFLGVLFILITSSLITCVIRNIKEKAFSAKQSGASVFGIAISILGFGAIQACAIGAPVCGASIGLGFIALFFPGISLHFLQKYPVQILVLSLIFQIFAMHFMGCLKLKKQNKNENSNSS